MYLDMKFERTTLYGKESSVGLRHLRVQLISSNVAVVMHVLQDGLVQEPCPCCMSEANDKFIESAADSLGATEVVWAGEGPGGPDKIFNGKILYKYYWDPLDGNDDIKCELVVAEYIYWHLERLIKGCFS